MAGSTNLTLKVGISIGSQTVPIKTAYVSGAHADAGVSDGFLFMLDLQPGQVVSMNLSDIYSFLTGMGFSAPTGNSNFSTVSKAFPSGSVSSGSAGSTVINIEEFSFNSSTTKKLFSISASVENSDPAHNGPDQFARPLEGLVCLGKCIHVFCCR